GVSRRQAAHVGPDDASGKLASEKVCTALQPMTLLCTSAYVCSPYTTWAVRRSDRGAMATMEETDMTVLTDNMTFGTFMAPFHRVGENPTLALERDLELIEWLDDLGFDEAWIGEHHSGGWETF